MFKHSAMAIALAVFSFGFGEARGQKAAAARPQEKVLDLGEIEIIGEVRRPNINMIYSKKYFNEAISAVAKQELKNLESELLQPEKISGRKQRQ